MAGPVKAAIQILPDLPSLSGAVARHIAERAAFAVKERGIFTLALSGGSTPRPMHEELASRFASSIPWEKVHIFWGDERYVSPEDAESNFRMARESLLERVPIPGENIHPMDTSAKDPRAAARAYQRELENFFPGPWPVLDLVVLGMGPDGHTASLFPGAETLQEQRRWVVPAQAPVEPRQRLTLTFPVLNRARWVDFMVSGRSKAAAVGRALDPGCDRRITPAGGIRPGSGNLLWWLDRAAAELLEPQA